MSSSSLSHAVTGGQTVETASALRRLYFHPRRFFGDLGDPYHNFCRKINGICPVCCLLFTPAWDVVGTFLDIRANQNSTSKTPQYVNAVISILTAVAVGIALQTGVPEALMGLWRNGQF